MAQKRMIDKKISVSEQISNLSTEGQLIFTWAIPHADDIGMLPYSLKTLKATIIPMIDMSLETFGFHWESIRKQNLIAVFEYKDKFWRICSFMKNQTLKRDRQPMTIIPFKLNKRPEISWIELISILPSGNHLEPNGFHLEPEVKRREEKRSKDKIHTASQDDANIPIIIDLFKEVNPSYQRLFGMPPQRKAVERLLKIHGKEQLISMISFLPKSNSSKYAPTITTPVQFELKLGDLIAWSQKEKDFNSKGKGLA